MPAIAHVSQRTVVTPVLRTRNGKRLRTSPSSPLRIALLFHEADAARSSPCKALRSLPHSSRAVPLTSLPHTTPFGIDHQADSQHERLTSGHTFATWSDCVPSCPDPWRPLPPPYRGLANPGLLSCGDKISHLLSTSRSPLPNGSAPPQRRRASRTYHARNKEVMYKHLCRSIQPWVPRVFAE